MRIRRNDMVLVTAGKDRGKKGKVLSADPKHGVVVVEAVNLVKRHLKASPNLRQAGIIEKPAPLPVSKVKVICDKCGKPTRTSLKVVHVQDAAGAEKREKVRVCKQCHQQIA